MDQRLFAPPHRLSQLITSFIASESQGIRHAPLLSFLIIAQTQLCMWDDIYFQLLTLLFCFVQYVIDLFDSLCRRICIQITSGE